MQILIKHIYTTHLTNKNSINKLFLYKKKYHSNIKFNISHFIKIFYAKRKMRDFILFYYYIANRIYNI